MVCLFCFKLFDLHLLFALAVCNQHKRLLLLEIICCMFTCPVHLHCQSVCLFVCFRMLTVQKVTLDKLGPKFYIHLYIPTLGIGQLKEIRELNYTVLEIFQLSEIIFATSKNHSVKKCWNNQILFVHKWSF